MHYETMGLWSPPGPFATLMGAQTESIACSCFVSLLVAGCFVSFCGWFCIPVVVLLLLVIISCLFMVLHHVRSCYASLVVFYLVAVYLLWPFLPFFVVVFWPIVVVLWLFVVVLCLYAALWLFLFFFLLSSYLLCICFFPSWGPLCLCGLIGFLDEKSKSEIPHRFSLRSQGLHPVAPFNNLSIILTSQVPITFWLW